MKKILFLIFIAFLSGCAASVPSYKVTINSINGGAPDTTKSITIVSGDEKISTADLQFKEYAIYIKRALEKKGYVVNDKTENADVVVFLKYGITDPEEHTYTYSVPVWGQTGYSSSSTYGTAYSYGNTATYSGSTTYSPTYGVVGATTHIGSYTTYGRYFSLTAYDMNVYRNNEQEVQLWQTAVVSTGSSGDLRRVFPIMVAASAEYIGENTGQRVEVSLKEEDEKVLQIKGIEIKSTDLPEQLDQTPKSNFNKQ